MNRYYNDRYPEAFRKNYESERDFYWSCIQKHFDAGFARKDLPQFINTFGIINIKLMNVFEINRDQAELIVSTCLCLIFDESVEYRNKILIIENLKLVLSKCKKQLKNYMVRWEPFYDELNKVMNKELDDRFVET